MLGRIIGLVIAGLIIGGLGRLVRPGPDPMPIWLTIVIGIVAAIVAGILISGVLGFILAVAIAALLVGAVGAGYSSRSGR